MKPTDTFAPIQLTIYDKNDEVVKELSTGIVRWNVMKQALKLADQIGEEVDEGTFNALVAFICFIFKDQVTPEEVETGADFGEALNVFRAVIQRAKAMGNV